MNARIEASADPIEPGARGSLRGLLDGARDKSRQAAAAVARGKAPLSRLAGLGIELSAVSQRTTDRVLQSQAALASGQLDLLAERFNHAARAESLTDLVAGQIRLTPAQFSRLGQDAKTALTVLVDGGSEARDVIRGGLGRAAAAKPARKQAATRAAGPRRQTASKKKASKKTASRRPRTRKTD